MLEALAACFIPKYARPYRVMHKPHLDVYTLLLPTTFMAHLTFHVSKLKLFKMDDKKPERKQKYHKGFNLMEHQLTAKIECILGAKQTQKCGKQYLIKWKGCHPKVAQWVSLSHLNHLPKMIKKFETEKGHELGHKKSHKKQMIGISIPWKT